MELVRHGSVDDLIADKLINLNDPWNNPSDHVAIADNIAGRIAEFFSAKPRDVIFDAAQSTRLGLTAEIMRMRSEIVGLKDQTSRLERSLAEKQRDDKRPSKNLDTQMKSPELVYYLNRHYKSVPGFSSLLSARVNAELLLWQRGQNISGSVAELGVYLGRSAIALALATDSPDRFLAMDKFVWPNNALERFQAFARKFGVSEDRLVSLAADARDVTPQQLLSAVEGHAFRFFHVDGDHAPEGLRKDLELVCEIMTKEGVLCLDDMLHPLYPELPVVVHRFLRNTDFRVFGIVDREDAVAATKYLLCRSHLVDKYQQALRAMFPDLIFPGDAEFENSRAVILSLDSAVIPYYQKLNAQE
jgi:predicted O-methyltransferase YrrM